MLRGIESEQFRLKTKLGCEGRYDILTIINKETEVKMDILDDEVEDLILILKQAKEILLQQ